MMAIHGRERNDEPTTGALLVRALLVLALLAGGCAIAAYGLSGPHCGNNTHGEWIYFSPLLFGGALFLILQKLVVRLWLVVVVTVAVGLAIGGALVVFALAEWVSHCTA